MHIRFLNCLMLVKNTNLTVGLYLNRRSLRLLQNFTFYRETIYCWCKLGNKIHSSSTMTFSEKGTYFFILSIWLIDGSCWTQTSDEGIMRCKQSSSRTHSTVKVLRWMKNHPMGEEGVVKALDSAMQEMEQSVHAICLSTPGGRFHVRWDENGSATALGQLLFFCRVLWSYWFICPSAYIQQS